MTDVLESTGECVAPQKVHGSTKSWRHSRVQLLGALLIGTMVATVGFTIHGVRRVRSQMDEVLTGEGKLLPMIADMDRRLMSGQLALKTAWENAANLQVVKSNAFMMMTRIQQLEHSLGEYQSLMQQQSAESRVVEALATSVHEWRTRANAIIDALLRKTPAVELAGDFDLMEAEYTRARRSLEALEGEFHRPENARNREDLIYHANALQVKIISTIVVGMIIGLVAALSIRRIMLSQESSLRERLSEQERDHAQREFDRRIQLALGMAQKQDCVLQVVVGAAEETWPGISLSVLLADSSHAHLRQMAGTQHCSEDHHCPVPTPNDCPAVRQGTRMYFSDSADFDACPHLRERPGEPVSALCLPVSAMGHSIGVVHVCSAPEEEPDSGLVDNLMLLAGRAGDRIGVLRAFMQSELQAATDSLTGLLNRRSLEAKIQEMGLDCRSYCVAYTDIDHFKHLNDMHGHDTGDRALRVFSQTLRNSIRPSDWVARWGGEEFVMIFPETPLPEAERILRRVQRALVVAVGSGGVPVFTASFGLAGPCCGVDFHERLELADEALLMAKRNGRNRVEISAGQPAASEDEESICLNVELPPPAEPEPVEQES